MSGGPGTLRTLPALEHPELLATPVHEALQALAARDPAAAAGIEVAPIDDELADTAAFCVAYGVSTEESGNCVLLTGRRAGTERTAGAVVLATTRVDVNGVARRELDVRKVSFTDRERAVAGSGMEYGGITPVGLPDDWPVLLDPSVLTVHRLVVGSGLRVSKLVLPGAVLAALPAARVVDGLGRPLR